MPSPILSISKGRGNVFKIPVAKTTVEPGFNLRGINYDGDPEEVVKLDPQIEVYARMTVEHGVRQTCFGSMVKGKFRITEGHRRRCGVRLAIDRKWLKPSDERALLPVMADPQNRTEDERILDMLLFNSAKPLELIEFARGVQRLRDDYQYDEQIVAAKTGESVTHIRNCVLLLTAHPALLDAVRRDEIAATTVIELVRELPDADAQLAAFETAREKADGGRITPKHLPVATGRLKRLSVEGTASPLVERRTALPSSGALRADTSDSQLPSAFSPTRISTPISQLSSDPDTAITDGDNKFIAGFLDLPIELPHKKVRATLHLVDERGLHYYGFTLKWPSREKGDGFLHEKPQRIGGQPTQPKAILLGLQRLQGELEGRTFTDHPEVMAALDRQIKALGEKIDPTPHQPGANGTAPSTGGTRSVVSADDEASEAAHNLETFIRCASQGGHGAASSGEQIANRLAKALAKIGDDLALCDHAVLRGAGELMLLMSGPWKTAAEKQYVFALVKKAAR